MDEEAAYVRIVDSIPPDTKKQVRACSCRGLCQRLRFIVADINATEYEF